MKLLRSITIECLVFNAKSILTLVNLKVIHFKHELIILVSKINGVLPVAGSFFVMETAYAH